MRLDLVADLRQIMVKDLPTRSSRERDAFAKLDAGEQAWRFLNWQSRLVHPHPRRIFRSIGLAESTAYEDHKAEINLLLAKLAAGLSVDSYLSSRSKDGYCLHLNGKKHGDDFDLLLNEWGIHHLHLPSQPGGSLRGKHNNLLLFAIIVPGAVYAISLGMHREWTAPRLVEEVVRSWPHMRFFIATDMMHTKGFTPAEHQQLRQAGMTTMTAVGDALYICRLTLGITNALVSAAITHEAGRLLRAVHQVSSDPSGLLLQMQKEAALTRMPWPRSPRLRVLRGSGPQRWAFAFQEEASNTTLMI